MKMLEKCGDCTPGGRWVISGVEQVLSLSPLQRPSVCLSPFKGMRVPQSHPELCELGWSLVII